MSSAAPSPASISTESSISDALSSIIETADVLTDLLGDFVDIPSSPASVALPLELPICKALRLPSKTLKLSRKTVKRIHKRYNAKVDHLRQVAQEEYEKISRSVDHTTLESIAELLQNSFKTSVNLVVDHAKRCAHEAHQLTQRRPKAVKPGPAPTVKRPFDKTFVAIFEYIFDTPRGRYIRMKDKQRLAKLSGMSYRQIAVWWQNRRARSKKKATAGQTVGTMTLEKALAKLQAEREKAKPSTALTHREIIIRTRYKLPLDDDEEDEPAEEDLEEGLCPRDQAELELRQLYANGTLPNLDVCNPPPGSFPDIFKQKIYPDCHFDAPIWPRIRPASLPTTLDVPVLDFEVSQLAELLDNNLELVKTEKVFVRRKIKFRLPLPPQIQAAIRRRDACRIRATIAPVSSPIEESPRTQPETEDTDLSPIPIVVTSEAEEARSQIEVQVTTNGNAEVESAEAHDSVNQLADGLAQANMFSNYNSPTGDQAPGDVSADPQDQYEDDWKYARELALHGSSYAPPSSDSPSALRDPMEAIPILGSDIAYFRIRTQHPAYDIEPSLSAQDMSLPFADPQLDDQMTQQALRMALRDIGWEGQIPPCTLFDPITRSTPANIAPDPVEPILEQLAEQAAVEKGDLTLSEVAYAHHEFDLALFADPCNVLGQAQTVPSSWDRDASIAWAQANYPNVSVDTYLGPTLRQYDPQGPSLPFALSDLNDKPEHFDHPMPAALYTWEPTIPTTLFTFEGKPIPEHDPNLKWETIIDYFEGHIQKAERKEARWAKRQNWPISSTDPRSMLQYLNL
ncbi:hypothetical protein FRC19_010198 [Serendipita sp. 401]|nr:hypothetical protein FRC19_010198 [Serendipita sp. 401]KAG9052720.1 hypothetical protein FS842_009346 [Serendipita sp. 407]